MTDRTERRFDPRYSIDGDLTNRFTYHPPEPEQPEVYQLVRDVAHLLALVVESSTYPSPERALAVTTIEQAVMWANAGIARRGLSHAAYAGAADVLENAIQALLAAKPEGRLAAGLSDTNPPHEPVDADDPWPPDGHVHPVLEPLPAGSVVDVLRSGLALIAGDHHDRRHDQEWACPGCIAQRVLNGDPIGQPTAEGDTAQEWTLTTDDETQAHPDHWNTVCPFCPAYICTEGHGAQRDAQEWVLDHAQQAHGKALRDG